MPSGGYRMNAGRKKKPAAQKIEEGNKGHRKVEIVEFGSNAVVVPETPPVYLSDKAKEIYISVYKWLESIDCLKGILPYNVEEYAFVKARWYECEEKNSVHGLLLKDNNGKLYPSPYVQMAQQYLRQTNESWEKIYQVVRESKLKEWNDTNPNNDVLASIIFD